MTKRDPRVRELRRAGGWKKQLYDILREHGGFRAPTSRARSARNGRTRAAVGLATQDRREEVLFRLFARLRELGYKIEYVRNITVKHVSALALDMEAAGLSASTIQNSCSHLRVFGHWIGKPWLVGDARQYVRDPERVRRHYAATADKSWRTNGVDLQEVLRQVSLYDERAGIILEVIAAFGLRRREGLALRPHLADEKDTLLVKHGTKGGRPRQVPIDSERKRAALERAKAVCGSVNAHLGWGGLSMSQSDNKLEHILRKFGLTRAQKGVTLHGLRAEYACDALEKRGVTPPVRGGDFTQGPKDVRDAACLAVGDELGHGRTGVMTAYTGAVRSRQPAPPVRGAPRPTVTPCAAPTGQVATPGTPAANDPEPGSERDAA